MSTLQTFYLMFKSNAKEAEKDMKSAQKTSKELRKEIKDAKDETTQLGRSFTDAFETGARALAAYASFSAMKSGIMNAQETNRALTIQSQLWKQNANDINAWGAAAKQAGGNAQGAIGWYAGIRQQNAAIGRGTLPIGQLMQHIRSQVKGASPEAAQMTFQRYGLADQGLQSMLMGSDEQWQKTVANMKELTNNTAAGAQASQQFGTSWDNLTTALTKFWTTVNTVILPPLAKFLDGLTYLFNEISENKSASVGFFVAMTAATTLFSAAVGSLALGFLKLGAAALSAMPAVVGLLAPVIAGGLAVGAGYAGTKWLGNKILGPGNNAVGRIDSSSAMNYLMSKYNLSSGQAAGIVANMQAESGGSAGAVGDGGSARGLFQWHPDRQKKILDGTGIDVTKASWAQQMDAMMWELKTRPEYSAFMKASSPSDAASIFSQKFEVPAGGLAEAMNRGQAALSIVGGTPFASPGGIGGGQSVNVGQINVHTQATDAEGISNAITGALHRQITNVFGQNSDAIQY